MKIVKTAVFVVLFALLTACGGGGGDAAGTTSPGTTTPPTTPGDPTAPTPLNPVATADVVSVTVDSAAAIVYTEMDLGAGFYNPGITAAYYTNQTETIIRMIKNGATSALTIVIPGSVTGTFTVGVSGVSVNYNDLVAYTGYFTANSGTVTVTKFDAVTGFVEGTFDVYATKTPGGTIYHLTGSFKATRVADQVV